MLYSGKIIRSIRNKYNLNLNKLAAGICTVSQLARIERGERNAEKLLFDCIYHRMGKYSERFEMLLDLDEYRMYEKRAHIQELIDSKKYDIALKEVLLYKNDTDNTLHLQLMCLYECEIMHRTNDSISNCMNKLMEGIQYTLPQFSFKNIEEYYLGRTEMYLITQYVRYIELSGDVNRAKELYNKLLEYISDNRYDRSERGNHYRHIGYWLAMIYFNADKYEQALKLAEKVYKETIINDFWIFLEELKELIILCNEKINKDMSHERKELEILHKLNLKYGIMKAEDFFPRYKEINNYNVNIFIKQRRILLGMTQEDLADEICDVTTISRIENNKITIRKQYKAQLLQKFNMSGDEYISCIDTYDFNVFKIINDIHDAIAQGKPEKINDMLNLITDKHQLDTVNTYQFFEVMRSKAALMINEYNNDILHSITDCLKLSLGDIKNNNLTNIFLLENEWMLISLLLIIYSNMDMHTECMNILSPIADTYLNPNNNYTFRCNEIAFNYGDLLGEMGFVEEGNNFLFKGIQSCINSDYLSLVPSLSYSIAWNILEMKNDIDKQEIQLCIEHLQYAYVLSNIFNNNSRKKRINELCQKHNISISF